MKSTTVEGRAKTKNGVTRLVFSVICILLEVIFIILMFTKLNRYAEAVNLLTRVVGVIVILNMYASPVTSTIKVPWILLILMFPIMGLGLYLLVGLNGGTEKMRRRYQKIDEQLLPLLPANRKITAENSKSRKYFFLYPQKCCVSGVSEYRCDLF